MSRMDGKNEGWRPLGVDGQGRIWRDKESEKEQQGGFRGLKER